MPQKKWYNTNKTFDQQFPFYHMFNKNSLHYYNQMYDKIINI